MPCPSQSRENSRKDYLLFSPPQTAQAVFWMAKIFPSSKKIPLSRVRSAARSTFPNGVTQAIRLRVDTSVLIVSAHSAGQQTQSSPTRTRMPARGRSLSCSQLRALRSKPAPRGARLLLGRLSHGVTRFWQLWRKTNPHASSPASSKWMRLSSASATKAITKTARPLRCLVPRSSAAPPV